MRMLILLGIMFLFSLALVSAEDIYKVNSEIDIKEPCFVNRTYCSETAECNITVNKPDGSNVVSNALMTNQIYFHNYTFGVGVLNETGDYAQTVVCREGSETGYSTGFFTVTDTGKIIPSGIVQIVFTLIFILLMAFLVFMVLYSVGRFSKFEFDIIDLAFNLGFFFALLAFYAIQNSYWGEPIITDFSLLAVKITAVTNVFIPFVLFIVILVYGGLMERKIPNVYR
jgi:hypothetical protein